MHWLNGIMTKTLNWGLKTSTFEFQLHYYIHFQANAPGKSFEPQPKYGLNK